MHNIDGSPCANVDEVQFSLSDIADAVLQQVQEQQETIALGLCVPSKASPTSLVEDN